MFEQIALHHTRELHGRVLAGARGRGSELAAALVRGVRASASLRGSCGAGHGAPKGGKVVACSVQDEAEGRSFMSSKARAEAEPKPVLELTSENFDETVGSGAKGWLVEFYAPW